MKVFQTEFRFAFERQHASGNIGMQASVCIEWRLAPDCCGENYSETGSARFRGEYKGVGVSLRSRSFMAEWHTMQDRCVRFPSFETKAYVSPCTDQVTTL